MAWYRDRQKNVPVREYALYGVLPLASGFDASSPTGRR